MCIGLHTLPPCLLFCGNYILHESEYDVHIFLCCTWYYNLPSPSPWSLWLSPSFILTSVSTRIANPRSAIRQTELSVACQRWGSVAEQSPANYWGIVTLHLAPHHPNSKSLPQAEPHFPLFIFNLHYLSPLDTSKIIWYYNLNYSFKKNRSFSPFFYTYFNVFADIL